MYFFRNSLIFTVLAAIGAMLLITSCGPVKSRVYSSPTTVAQQTVKEEIARRTQLYTFEYQEKTHDCRNANGRIGYNVGQVGPCAFITDLAQLTDYHEGNLKGADLRGAVFFRLALKEETDFSETQLDHSQWLGVTGTKINFENSSMTGSKFFASSITDSQGKPVVSQND